MASSANFGNIFSMVLAGLILPFLPLLPIQGHCHVWTAPLIKGYFGTAQVVGRVMSSAFCAENRVRRPDLSADPLPQIRPIALTAQDNATGFRINPLSCTSPLGHLDSVAAWASSASATNPHGVRHAGISR